MIVAKGICKCGLPIHLTRRCGWLHDGKENHDHRTDPIFESDGDNVIIPQDNFGRTNTMPQLFEHICKRLQEE